MDINSAISTDLMRPEQNGHLEASLGEGLAGYLFRRQADLPSGAFQRIQGRAGGLRGIEHLHRHLDTIAAATGTDVGVLRRMAYMPKKSRLWCRAFAEQDVRRAMIGFCAPKVCPICLAEGGTLRQVWDLKFYTDCPRHGVEMINVCPWCEPRTRITWQRTSVGQCDQCGGHYAEAPRAPSDASVLGILAEIERLAAGEESRLLPALNSATAPALRLEALLEIVLLLGREVVRHWGMTTSVIPTSDLEKTRLLLRGAAIVLDGAWPASYHRFLDAVSEKVGPADRPDIRKLLPSFYRQLFIRPRAELRKTGVLAPLQREFSSWLGQSRPDLAERMSRACLAVRGDDGVIPLTKLQSAFGIDARKLTHVIRELGIRMIDARWGKGTTFVARADVARLRAELSRRVDSLYARGVLQQANLAASNPRLRASRRSLAPYIDFSRRFSAGRDFPSHRICAGIAPSTRIPVIMIARRWGVQPYVVQKAIRAGAFSLGGVAVRRSNGLTAEVYGAFEAALAKAVKRLRRGGAPAISFRKAHGFRGLRAFGFDIAEILRCILSGELRVVLAWPKQQGLARLALRRGPLDRFADVRIGEPLAGKCDAKAAMKMLNTVSPMLLPYLVRHGHLRFQRIREVGCYVYDPADIKQFLRTFVGPREIGQKGLVPGTGRSPRVISTTLRRLGVKPTMGPGVDECPLVYYRREDVRKFAVQGA